jgi:hypothetical protein
MPLEARRGHSRKSLGVVREPEWYLDATDQTKGVRAWGEQQVTSMGCQPVSALRCGKGYTDSPRNRSYVIGSFLSPGAALRSSVLNKQQIRLTRGRHGVVGTRAGRLPDLRRIHPVRQLLADVYR